MAVPNRFDLVQKTFTRQAWDLSSIEGIGRFTEAVAVELHTSDQRWGHLRKSGGTQYNGHAANAVLYLSDAAGQSTAVDICRIQPPEQGFIRWNPDEPRYSPGDWIKPVPTEPAPLHQTRLGASLFWLLGGYRSYRVQLSENLRWYRQELGADFVRGFVVLGGDLFGGNDPWSRLATNWRDPGFVSFLREVADYVDDHGLRVAWTLVGGRAQVPDESSQAALVDRVLDGLASQLDTVEYFEPWNEYLVNNGVRHELRAMARRLKAGLPRGFPIALSSPNCVMGGRATAQEVRDELFAMYGGDSGANLVTIHSTRPEPIWRCETVMPLVRAMLPSFSIAEGEPRGPAASAGGDVDSPAILAEDYASAIRVKARSYVYHSMAGIWGGHCDPAFPSQNAVSNVWEHRNAAQIAAALKALRQTGSIPTIPVPGDPMKPYPEESGPNAWWPAIEEKMAGLYKRAFEEGKRSTPDPDWAAFRWSARMAYDIAVGVTKETAAEKHLKDLAKALGVAA